MERLPQNEIGIENVYNREAIATNAAREAERILDEQIDESLSLSERVVAVKVLMEELGKDNGNRHVVEAIAQRLSIETAADEYQSLMEKYPLVA
jgi:hypothetical protein